MPTLKSWRAVLGEVLAEMSALASRQPTEHAYRLRGPGGNKALVSEPRALNAFEIASLAHLATRAAGA
jgi:hypothetical protein